MLPEKKPLTDADLAPGMHQRLPGKARFIELSGKQRLHLAAQKIACCRIAFAHRLRSRSGAAAQQARGEHSRVVENQQIIWAQQLRKIAEPAIYEAARGSFHMQQA